MDSISRDYVMILPLKLGDLKNRIVTTMFVETRFVKNGTINSVKIYERLHINEYDKIDRVVQFSIPSSN